jgi:hypothetical protein
MTISKSWARNFGVDLTANPTELYRPGEVPGDANSEVVQGLITGLLGVTDAVIPPVQAGASYSGVSVQFWQKSAPASPLVPWGIWDLAANGDGRLVDLLLFFNSSQRHSVYSKTASLWANISVGSSLIPAGKKVWIYGTANEGNEY